MLARTGIALLLVASFLLAACCSPAPPGHLPLGVLTFEGEGVDTTYSVDDVIYVFDTQQVVFVRLPLQSVSRALAEIVPAPDGAGADHELKILTDVAEATFDGDGLARPSYINEIWKNAEAGE